MRRGRWGLWSALGFMMCALVAPANVAAQSPDLRRVYEQILRDPTNTALNLRYARLAIEREELRKALSAYERILARDPDNEDAASGLRRIRRLLEPPFTTAVAYFGTQFETNPAHFNFNSSKNDDLVLFGLGQLIDERRIGRFRWRTEGDIFANWHERFRELDFGNVGGRIGPILDLHKDWRVRPSFGLAYSWLDGKTFFVEPATALEFESDTSGPLKSIVIRAYYDFVGNSFSSRDAYQISVNTRLVWAEVGAKSGFVIVNPYYRFNGVVGSGDVGRGPTGDPFPLRHHDVGVRVDYIVDVLNKVTAGLTFTAEYSRYSEPVAFGTKNRRDVLISPGAQLVFAGLLHPRSDLILSYQFEYNDSNDEFEEYTNHIVGVRVSWRF